jgi:hypothetical protein
MEFFKLHVQLQFKKWSSSNNNYNYNLQNGILQITITSAIEKWSSSTLRIFWRIKIGVFHENRRYDVEVAITIGLPT